MIPNILQTRSRAPGLCFLAFLVLSPTTTWGQTQTNVKLTGVVVEADSRTPVVNAVVEIFPLNLRVRTDERGRYEIGDLPAGRYTVLVRMMGRVLRTEPVVLTPGAQTVLDVALEADAVRLPAIEVLRSRTELARNLDDIPGSVYVISAEEVTHRNPFHDVHQMLRQVPGVNVQEEEGFGLRPNIGLRATGSERSSKITVMEDGILIAPAPYAAPSAYYFPVVGRMHGVEVRKGSSQIKYGPRTVGGAINLVSTPIPDELQANLDIAGGSFFTRRVAGAVGGAGSSFGWLVQGYKTATNGFKQLAAGGTGFNVGDYNAKLRLHTDRRASTYQELEIKLGYNRQRSDETYLGLTEADFVVDPNLRYPASQQDVMRVEHRQLHVRHFIRPSGQFDLTTTVYRNETDRNWYKLQSVLGTDISRVLDQPDGFTTEMAVLKGGDSRLDDLRVRANNRTYFGHGIQSIVGLQFGGHAINHEIEIGARYHEDQEDRFQHEDGFHMLANRMVLTDRGAPGSQSNRVSDARALALFIQDRIDVGSWSVTPGVRFETIDFTRTDYRPDDPNRVAPDRVRENGVSVLIPGIGASYAVRNDLRLFGGVHRGFSPPSPGADGETRAETSVSYELGARYNTGEVNAQLVGFFSDYANILGAATLATGGTGVGDQFNGGAVNAFGVETSLQYTPLGLGGTSLRVPWGVTFTYTKAQFQTAFESDFAPWGSVEKGDRVPYIAGTQLSGWVGVEHNRWSITAGANYSAAMRTVAGQGALRDSERTDAFAIVNVSADYEFGQSSSFYVTVQNLTGASYVVARRPAGARPGLPRTILGGVRIRR
jgi:Fe(3+) dicitrate transport protein